MNEVDFLPESYRKVKRRRGRMFRQGTLMAIAVSSFVLWGVALKTHSVGQRQYAEQLESTLVSEQGKLQVLAQLNNEYGDLQRQLKLNRELSQPVTFSQIIGYLGVQMPDEVAITELVLNARRPKPEPLAEESATSGRRTKDDRDAGPEPNYIQIELEGVAPNDLSLANFISAVDENPLFSQVYMGSSRTIEMKGLVARQFRMSAVVELDRDFVWASVAEVSDVD